MTIEETLYNARHLSGVHHNICLEAESFWKNVIDALEAEPCVDCVSRESVLETFSEWVTSGESCFRSTAYQLMNQRIHDLPSVTPAPKMGRWIEVDEDCGYECSLCKAWMGSKTKYCPDCGAKMEVQDADSD